MVNAYNFILIISCYFIANMILAPALPTIELEFETTSLVAKSAMSYYLFGALLSCVIAAFFADYTGKKNFLLFGICMVILGSILGMTALNIDMLLLARALQGFGAATGFMLGFALLIDLYETPVALKIIALNGVVVSVISVFVPYLGGLIVELASWRFTFLATLIAFLIALFISARFLPPEANKRTESADLMKGLKQVGVIVSSRDYLAYGTLNGIFIAGMLYFITAAPFYFKAFYAYGAVENGLMIGLVVWATFAVGSRLSTRLYDRLGIDRTIWLGLSVICLSMIALSAVFITSDPDLLFWIIWGSVGGYCFGFGLLYSGSITGCMRIFPDLTTKASAIRTIMLTGGSLIGALFAQIMDDQSVGDLFIFFAATALVGVVMFSLKTKAKN